MWMYGTVVFLHVHRPWTYSSVYRTLQAPSCGAYTWAFKAQGPIWSSSGAHVPRVCCCVCVVRCEHELWTFTYFSQSLCSEHSLHSSFIWRRRCSFKVQEQMNLIKMGQMFETNTKVKAGWLKCFKSPDNPGPGSVSAKNCVWSSHFT